MTDAEDTLPAWTGAEKLIAGLGLVLAAGVLVILADVVTGGRLLKRCGCGQPADTPEQVDVIA